MKNTTIRTGILSLFLAVSLTAQGKIEATAVPAKVGLFFAQSSQQLDKIIGRGIALGDFNGDGHLDAWVANQEESQVCFGDGRGGFTPSGQRQKVPWGKPVVGDISGDGRLEVITGNHVWLNDGKGNFRDSRQVLDEGGSHVHGLALVDLNGDGRLDLVMGIQDDKRSGRIYLNDGKGRFIGGANLDGAGGENLALADFDGDGRLDVFVAATRPPSRVWLNEGTGKLRDSGVRLGDRWDWDVAAGDLNGDGKSDAMTVGFVNNQGLKAASPQVWLNTSAKSAAPSAAGGK